jgi:hypothetical protein
VEGEGRREWEGLVRMWGGEEAKEGCSEAIHYSWKI